MGLKKIKSEGGSGGKRGHSNMNHWFATEEIKLPPAVADARKHTVWNVKDCFVRKMPTERPSHIGPPSTQLNTLSVMGDLEKSSASLRIFGDSIVPEEITALLGAAPTSAYAKGDILVGPRTGIKRIAPTGRWGLKASDRKPGDFDAQVHEILDQLTDDIKIWRKIAGQHDMDLFCGAFMNSSNDGIILSANTLWHLGNRGIELNLDIYGGRDDDEAEPEKSPPDKI